MSEDAPVAASADEDAALVPEPDSLDTLRQAMRRARQDNAERSGVVADLRGARLGRLELLAEALKPLIAQIPPDVDIFDIGLMPGANPRLFIDMIGFIEMGRDARVYRLLQDTRHGRMKIVESENVETMVDAVTDYVARRLLERDKALAADAKHRSAARLPDGASTRGSEVTSEPSRFEPRTRGGIGRWSMAVINFIINFLGWLTFFAILAGVGWYLWQRAHGAS